MELTNEKSFSQKVICFFLFLNPILDVITSYSLHRFGYSMPFVLILKFFFLIYLFVLSMKYFDKKVFRYCLLVGIYFGVFLLLQYVTKGSSFLMLEAQNLFRTFYFPFVFSFLILLDRKNVFKLKSKYLVMILFLYLFFLVIPTLTGLGFDSYAHSKSGNIGWFYSTNEIGGILAILGPFLLVYLKKQNWIVRIFSILFYLMGIFVLGTKVPMLAFGIMICFFLGVFFKKLFQKREWKKIAIGGVCSILCAILFSFAVIQSSFYKNIQIHLDFLEIHQVSDLFTFHHIDHFIFSERLSFLVETHSLYQSSSLISKVFGMGIGVSTLDGASSMKMIEMDYFDVFYHYGILGTILFVLPFFLFLRKRKYQMDEVISIVLILLLALFSGHILVSPSVSVLAALVLIPKKDEVER